MCRISLVIEMEMISFLFYGHFKISLIVFKFWLKYTLWGTPPPLSPRKLKYTQTELVFIGCNNSEGHFRMSGLAMTLKFILLNKILFPLQNNFKNIVESLKRPSCHHKVIQTTKFRFNSSLTTRSTAEKGLMLQL